MPSFTDQLGSTIFLDHTPRRIISLVPSQTELLYTLGLDEQVVGITKFCVHPDAWFRTKTRIGGTKDIHPERIDALRPDLIIANKEENIKEQVEALASRYPVWTSDCNSLSKALDMIRSIGSITDTAPQAEELAAEIALRFSALTGTGAPKPRVAYFIWRNPYMVAGGDTFINDLLGHAGFDNIFHDRLRYPAVTLENLKDLRIDCILLSSEPYPFSDKHIAEIRTILPGTSIRLVDGESFSWYGSRLLEAPAYFQSLREGLA